MPSPSKPSPSEEPKFLGLWIEADPEIWLEELGSDPFSTPLTSFRLTLDGFTELLGSLTTQETTWIDRMRETVRGAVSAASLKVTSSEAESLADSIVKLYVEFNTEILQEARKQAGAFKAVRTVPTAPGDRSNTSVAVTLVGLLEIEDDQAEEKLKRPLIDLVAPFTPAGVDPAISAAEVGLSISLARSSTDIQVEALMVSAVSTFEAFLTAVVEAVVALNPSLLRASKMTFDARAVLDAEDRTELLDRLRGDFINGHTRSFDALSKFFDQVLGLEEPIVNLREVVETRNVLVHHSGVVTRQYVNACPDSSYAEGEKIHVGGAYLADCLRQLNDVALIVITESRARFLVDAPAAPVADDD